MSVYDPFPSINLLSKECRAKWPSYSKAAKSTIKAERKLRKALLENMPSGQPLDSDSCLILCGSFARYEMNASSDYDWSLLIDGIVKNRHAKLAKKVGKAMKDGNLIAPGSSGTFGSLIFSHDLVHRIGGGADSNANLTRRMLMLLESKPFSIQANNDTSQVWDNVIKNILERYFEQDIHFSAEGKSRVPRFLLNDLTRYWRTICVDYAAKHREQDGDKWAMRNAKLRLSRKLIYASGLAFCLSCELKPPKDDMGLFGMSDAKQPHPFVDAAIRFSQTPSLEYLAAFILGFVDDKSKRRRIARLVFGSYDQWLTLMSKKAVRNKFEELTHEDAEKDTDFDMIRKIGIDFSKGLKLLFFGREKDSNAISNLCLDYVGF